MFELLGEKKDVVRFMDKAEIRDSAFSKNKERKEKEREEEIEDSSVTLSSNRNLKIRPIFRGKGARWKIFKGRMKTSRGR